MNTQTNNYSIMDCSKDQLIMIIRDSLQRFDDYEQMAGDLLENEMNEMDELTNEMGFYFTDSYFQLEKYLKIIQTETITPGISNEIRSLIKETEKMASVLFIADIN